MTDGYLVEKFSLAAYGLAIGTRSIQQRVAEAFIDDLIHVMGNSALPLDVGLQFRAYEKAWKAEEAEGQGRINAWAAALTVDQAIDVAKWIYNTAMQVRDEFRDK